MIENFFPTLNYMDFAGKPAAFAIFFGFVAMYLFHRPTFGIIAAIFGALLGLAL